MSEPLNYGQDHSVESILSHSRRELQIAGFLDKENPNFEVTAPFAMEILDLIERIKNLSMFDGVTLFHTLELIVALTSHKNITPLTSSPEEWMDISDFMGGNACWQNRRNPSVFSKDGGKTCFDVDSLKKRSKITGIELPEQHIEWTEEDFVGLEPSQFLKNSHVVSGIQLSNTDENAQ
jgi:hypothetical protein